MLVFSFVAILVLGVASVAIRTYALLRYADEIEGCPQPDICPGCDGYLDFDDDGSNICTACGLAWWRR